MQFDSVITWIELENTGCYNRVETEREIPKLELSKSEDGSWLLNKQ